MKILQINTVYGEGSTGRIVKEIQEACKANQIHCAAACRYSTEGAQHAENVIEISTPADSRIHGILSQITMFKGC